MLLKNMQDAAITYQNFLNHELIDFSYFVDDNVSIPFSLDSQNFYYYGGNHMANRPVFYACDTYPYAKVIGINFTYYSGFAVSQKQKSFLSLHENYKEYFPNRQVLEISSKSNVPLGVSLSAFHLKINLPDKSYSVENAFQSSKVFALGGPFTDLLQVTPKEAKRDARLKNSGRLVSFQYLDKTYPLQPVDAFYNWIYINALRQNPELAEEILAYDSFTDIEFNPEKSVNCQAKAAARFIGLSRAGLIDEAMNSFEDFLRIAYHH